MTLRGTNDSIRRRISGSSLKSILLLTGLLSLYRLFVMFLQLLIWLTTIGPIQCLEIYFWLQGFSPYWFDYFDLANPHDYLVCVSRTKWIHVKLGVPVLFITYYSRQTQS